MIKMLHLYPNLMNLYGDYGNIVVLKKHLLDQGQEVQIDKIDVAEKIDFSKYDFVYMGPGIESNQLVALEDLLKYKGEILEYIKNNKTLLFTGNAMELLGKSIDDNKALGVFDFTVKHTSKRYTGDVILQNKHLNEVVGFINKCSIISGNKEDRLFSYVFKDNNLVDNDYEGFSRNNAFATEVIGPVLVKNPSFMEKIVISIVGKENYVDNKSDYIYENESYETTLNALRKRK